MRCCNVFVMHSCGARNVSGTSLQINRTDKRNMKRTLLLIAVIVIVGALPVFWQYGTFMICTDYMRQQIPFIMETKRMLESGTPFWSWNTYVGDNFWAGYAFYSLTSPFVWLVALLPYRCIVHGLFPRAKVYVCFRHIICLYPQDGSRQAEQSHRRFDVLFLVLCHH